MSNAKLLTMFLQLPCAECGKKPCHACYIMPIEKGGTPEYFNYMPLCVKHCSEQMRLGTVAMCNKYVNVKRYITSKGWTLDKKLNHRDLKGEQ